MIGYCWSPGNLTVPVMVTWEYYSGQATRKAAYMGAAASLHMLNMVLVTAIRVCNVSRSSFRLFTLEVQGWHAGLPFWPRYYRRGKIAIVKPRNKSLPAADSRAETSRLPLPTLLSQAVVRVYD